MRLSVSIAFAVVILLPVALGTLNFQEGSEYVYAVDGSLVAGQRNGDGKKQATAGMTSTFVCKSLGLVDGKVPNEPVWGFVANMFGTKVTDNNPNPNAALEENSADSEAPLGSDIYFYQRKTGQIVEIDYDADDSAYYTQVKIGVINSLHTLIPSSPSSLVFKDEDAVGVHFSSVQSKNEASNYVTVYKSFNQTGFFAFADPNLKKHNVVLNANGAVSIHPDGYIFSSNSQQTVDLIDIASKASPVDSEAQVSTSPVDINLHSNGNMKVNFQSIQKSNRFSNLKERKPTNRVSGPLALVAYESQIAVEKSKVSSGRVSSLIKFLFGEKNQKQVSKPMRELIRIFRASPQSITNLQKVLVDIQTSGDVQKMERVFYILGSVSNSISEDFLIRFGIQSPSLLIQEKALFSLNFYRNPSVRLMKATFRLYQQREDLEKDSASPLLAYGSLSSRSFTPKSYKANLLSAASDALTSKGKPSKVIEAMYALVNAGEEVVSTKDIENLPFEKIADSGLKLRCQKLIHKSFGIKLKDGDFPYNVSKNVAYTLGGQTISSTFTANAFLGTNFDCNHPTFNFEAEADAQVSVSLFQQSQEVLKAEAIYSQDNGATNDEAFLSVWGKVVKQYTFPQLNCVSNTIPVGGYSPGFDVGYTVWVSIIPITFDAAASLDLQLSIGYNVCPAQLTAQLDLLPTAAVEISGSANIDLLIIKAGVELDGSFQSAIVPTAFVQGSECTVGYNVVMQNQPMTITFDAYYERKVCHILWIWDCKPGDKKQYNIYSWALPAQTKTLVQKSFKIAA